MIPILMYHQVAALPRSLDPRGLAVTPGQFEQQMSYLARRGYCCLTLSEALWCMCEGAAAPPRSFVLTFDDGYADLHAVVCPILERFEFTATVFLVSGRIGCASDWTGQEGARSGRLLTWEQARNLARRSITFGSHTATHRRLTGLDDRAASEEITSSKRQLEDGLDAAVDFFSYPYSDTDGRTEQLVEAAGYQAACAGPVGAWGRFHLWRVPCGRDDSALSYALKVGGWYDRRTALRESGAGRWLLRTVHTIRGKPVARSMAAS